MDLMAGPIRADYELWQYDYNQPLVRMPGYDGRRNGVTTQRRATPTELMNTSTYQQFHATKRVQQEQVAF